VCYLFGLLTESEPEELLEDGIGDNIVVTRNRKQNRMTNILKALGRKSVVFCGRTPKRTGSGESLSNCQRQ
jgi:choline kinase